MIAYTFEMEDKVKQKLEKIAEESHRTLASQLRFILEEYLESLSK